MIFFGLDVGSSGCKCVAFSEEGKQLASYYREYTSAAGQADMNPAEMYGAVCEVITGCAADGAVAKNEIAAISVTSFGESFVPVSKSGKELADIIMYTDKRGRAETERLIQKVGGERIMEITCVRPDSMYSLPKIMWTMENVPGVRENVWKFLLIGDYICYKLSGEANINYSLACRALALDLEKRAWSEELLGAAGIGADMLSKPVPCGSVVGEILPSQADKLGLPRGVKIVVSAHDQISAAVGAGVLKAGQATDGTGSVECITPVFENIKRGENFTGQNYVCVPHPNKNLYATYAFSFSGGVLLKWFRDCFASGLKNEAASRGVSVYRMLDESCPAEPSPVVVVPHFMGAGGTPDMVASAKGTITGLTMKTTLPDIYRAILEGLTFEMAYNIEMLSLAGIKIDTLCATGGGARSPVWLQIKADIFGRPIIPSITEEAGAAGCAMLAAVALGRYKNLEEAAEKFVRHAGSYTPSGRFSGIYEDKYGRYKEARRAMLGIMS